MVVAISDCICMKCNEYSLVHLNFYEHDWLKALKCESFFYTLTFDWISAYVCFVNFLLIETEASQERIYKLNKNKICSVIMVTPDIVVTQFSTQSWSTLLIKMPIHFYFRFLSNKLSFKLNDS